MSTSPHHRKQCDRRRPDDPSPGHGPVRRTQDLFARANPFLDAVWLAAESGVCLSTGCTDCGTLEFRRMLASVDGPPASPTDPLPRPRATAPDAPGALASALAAVDFDLLRLAPRWYDALDIALYHVRDRAELGFVLDDWLRRPTVPVRILDLVLFRHARYGFPGERVADLWIERCLDAACDTEDEGIVESLILACPERVGSDPRALRAALETATRSACVRAVVRRLGDCA